MTRYEEFHLSVRQSYSRKFDNYCAIWGEISKSGLTIYRECDGNSQHGGIIIRDSNSHFYGETSIQMSGNDAIGLDILGGTHQLEGLSITKPYSNADTSSIGAQFWYSISH